MYKLISIVWTVNLILSMLLLSGCFIAPAPIQEAGVICDDVDELHYSEGKNKMSFDITCYYGGE